MSAEEEAEFTRDFEGLYRQAHRTARRLVGDAATAEDIAAEALARTFARWKDVRGLPYRDAWVLRVTTNLALDHLTRRRAPMQVPSVSPTEDVVLRVTLVAALRELSKRQREIIVLRHIVGLQESEIARVLGIGEGTVKTHTRRAIETLRRRLGDGFAESVSGV